MYAKIVSPVYVYSLAKVSLLLLSVPIERIDFLIFAKYHGASLTLLFGKVTVKSRSYNTKKKHI